MCLKYAGECVLWWAISAIGIVPSKKGFEAVGACSSPSDLLQFFLPHSSACSVALPCLPPGRVWPTRRWVQEQSEWISGLFQFSLPFLSRQSTTSIPFSDSVESTKWKRTPLTIALRLFGTTILLASNKKYFCELEKTHTIWCQYEEVHVSLTRSAMVKNEVTDRFWIYINSSSA